jgi:SARP family transcriptional regulator, regulator of embCAB operon
MAVGSHRETAQRSLPLLTTRPGRQYPLEAAATRIGRLSDNETVILHTGTSFMIMDLPSVNGVDKPSTFPI